MCCRAQPNVLGDAEDFVENFVRPIELGQKANATKRELAEARRSESFILLGLRIFKGRFCCFYFSTKT
jgi:hypothetical protein